METNKILRFEVNITKKIGSRFVESSIENQVLIFTDKKCAPYSAWEWAQIETDYITLYWEEIGVENTYKSEHENELLWLGKKENKVYQIKVVDISE